MMTEEEAVTTLEMDNLVGAGLDLESAGEDATQDHLVTEGIEKGGDAIVSVTLDPQEDPTIILMTTIENAINVTTPLREGGMMIIIGEETREGMTVEIAAVAERIAMTQGLALPTVVEVAEEGITSIERIEESLAIKVTPPEKIPEKAIVKRKSASRFRMITWRDLKSMLTQKATMA